MDLLCQDRILAASFHRQHGQNTDDQIPFSTNNSTLAAWYTFKMLLKWMQSVFYLFFAVSDACCQCGCHQSKVPAGVCRLATVQECSAVKASEEHREAFLTYGVAGAERATINKGWELDYALC